MKVSLLLLAFVALSITVCHSRTVLGADVGEIMTVYGRPEASDTDAERPWIKVDWFKRLDGHDGSQYGIAVSFVNDKASRIVFNRFDAHGNGLDFPETVVQGFLKFIAPNAVWRSLKKDAKESTWEAGDEATPSYYLARLSHDDARLEFSNDDYIVAENKPPPTPIPTPRPTPTPDPAILAGPKPAVGGVWGVSLAVHDAIKEKLNDPDSYKFVGTYEPQVSTYEGKPCWIEIVKFRAKNAFGAYILGKAGIFITVGSGGQENILDVELLHD